MEGGAPVALIAPEQQRQDIFPNSAAASPDQGAQRFQEEEAKGQDHPREEIQHPQADDEKATTPLRTSAPIKMGSPEPKQYALALLNSHRSVQCAH